MAKPKTGIPYYTDINEFLASIPWPGSTTNPNFYCLRLKKLNQLQTVYKPPFKRSFHFFGLFLNFGSAQVDYDNTTVRNPEGYLVFHSPNLVYSFSHSNSLDGYVVYFKSACFSFFKPDFDAEFPIFDPLQTNLFKLDHAAVTELAPHFDEVFATYDRSSSEHHLQARIKLLALLYHLQGFALERKREIRIATPQQILLRKYIQLINNHYIDKRTVKEYADLLCITPNYLSQSIKAVSDQNALTYISERVVREAKSLIQYTNFEISEIAYQLKFQDVSSFGKFFKAQTGMSPSSFRKLNR